MSDTYATASPIVGLIPVFTPQDVRDLLELAAAVEAVRL